MKRKDTAKRNKHYHCLEYDHDPEGGICLVACGMEECDPGVTYGPELRDCYHLHVILSGSGTLYAGGKVFHPHLGQMFLLKDNEVVQYTADETNPWHYCWVTYNGSEAKRLSEEIGFVDGVYCLNMSAEPRAFFEMVLRMHEKPEMNYVYDLRRRGILLEFLSLAMEATETPARKKERRYEYSTEDYVRKAIDFINYNYATIHVSDVIEYIGFTRSYFSTIFKKQTGVSLQEYLIQRKLQQSCTLLLNSGMSIKDIAIQIGCENALSFSRTFKHTYGISPTEYRQQGGF